MKKLFSLITALSIILLPVVFVNAAGDISVTLDGKEIEFDAKPQIINERVMVPMRKMFETIGANILWDGETSAATAIKEAQYAKFTKDTPTMELGVCTDGKDDGELSFFANEDLDSAPVIIDGTMYVPMRALAEAFHYNVEWNAERDTAEITTPTDADGWIYYSSWSDGGHMYKIDTNGQHRQMISDDDCYMELSRFQYRNGYIFYSIREPENPAEEGKLFRIKTDGTGKEQLTDIPVNIISDYYGSVENSNKYIYFRSGSKDSSGYIGYQDVSICRLDTETAEIEEVFNEPVSDFDFYGGYIYFRYISDKLDKAHTYFRMDEDGENIINVTGDIAADTFYVNEENEKITFGSYNGSGKYYTANLDGSEAEENKSFYDSNYGLSYAIASGDGVAFGRKEYDYDSMYIMDENGNELAKITPPEGYEISYGASFNGDRLYYQINPEWSFETKKIYVDSLDELLGRNRISVSAEKVDGKYEIDTGEYIRSDDYYDNMEIHSIKKDGSNDTIILKGFDLTGIEDGQLNLYNYGTDNYEYGRYTASLDGNNIQKYEYDYEEEISDIVSVNEKAYYGIVVKNDGTVSAYLGNKWWLY